MSLVLTEDQKSELKVVLDRHRNYAQDYMNTAMTGYAREAWEYYYGNLPAAVTAGGSKYVDRTVWETVNGTLQDLLNVFTTGEDAVVFASVDERDSDAAKIATQTVNQILLRDNDGYNILQSALKECLVTRNSFIKRYWDVESKSMTESVEGVNSQELNAYIKGLEDAGVRDIDATILVDEEEHPEGLVDATISYVLDVKHVRVEYTPIEEILIDEYATSIQDATYFCHRTRKSKRELLDMGFPEDQIESMNEYYPNEDTNRTTVTWARTDWRVDLDNDIGTDSQDLAARIWVYEHYVRTSSLDAHENVRLYQVFEAGNIILEVNEVNDIPFETFTPYPIPGAIFGESIYDITKDIQDLRTAIIRGYIDNVNNANYGRYTAIQGAYDRRSLLDNRPGGVVEMERDGAVNLFPYHSLPNGIDQLLGMTDEVKEVRTGVTRLGMGINPDVFKNDNAYATVGLMMNAAQNRIRMVSRNIANGGMTGLMKSIYKLFRENGENPLTIQTSRGLVQISPKQLPPRENIITSVAISPSEKQQRAQNLMTIKAMLQQDQTLAPLFTMEQDRYMTSEIMSLMGVSDVHNYIMPLEQYQPPQPSQAEILQLQQLQGQVNLLNANVEKLQHDGMLAENKLAFEQQKAADETQQKNVELQYKQEESADRMSLENRKADNEATVDQMKHNLALMQQQVRQYEATLKELEINLNGQLEAHKLVHSANQSYESLRLQSQSQKQSKASSNKSSKKDDTNAED